MMLSDEFVSRYRAAVGQLRFSDAELADFLDVSIPTLQRWASGKNLPYRLIRSAVIKALEERLDAKDHLGSK